MVLYKFYKDDCIPCKQLSMQLKKDGIETIDIDVKNPAHSILMDVYEIMSVPTLVNTETREKKVGLNGEWTKF